MRIRRFTVTLLGLTIFVACSDDPTGPPVDGTVSGTGGTVQAAQGAVVLVFPAGAVSSNVGIVVTPNPSPPQDSLLVAGTAYEFGPDGTQFAQPVQLTIRYDEARLRAGTLEESLAIHKAVGNGWQMVGGSVNTDQNTVTAPINSFSTYAILSVPVASVTISPDSVRLVIGDTVVLTATLRDAAGNILTGRKVEWKSDSVVVVSPDGRVRGRLTGTASVFAYTSDQRKFGQSRITVSPRAALSLAVGMRHSCALDEAGKAYCWGSNGAGQLGDGTRTDSQVPVAVSGAGTFTRLSAGGSTTCGLNALGEASCWGSNSSGALGNGGATVNGNVAKVSGALQFSDISVGAFNYACGVTTTGAGYCWGRNRFGQLGTGDTLSSSIPVPVAGGLTFRSISAGLTHTCGVTTGGEGYCWGSNGFRQIDGVRSEAMVPTPARVAPDLSFTSLQAGNTLTCGIAGGVTVCWGRQFFGSKGNGSTTSTATIRTQVLGGESFTAVRPGKENNIFAPVCGLTSTGAAYCWGANNVGQLGSPDAPGGCTFASGPFSCASTPVPIAGGLTFATVVAAGGHGCGITRDQRAFCWGANVAGELGDGSTAQRVAPVAVVGGLRFP